MNFEEFIKSKKEDLHTEVPDFKVWNGIQQQLQPKKAVYKMWLAAASVVLIIGTGLFFLLQTSPKKENDASIANTKKENNTPKKENQIAISTLIQKDTTTLQPTVKITDNVRPIPAKELFAINAHKNSTVAKQTAIQSTKTDFYDSTINALKQRIEATPVRYVGADYFSVYVQEYKRLESEESTVKQLLTKNTTPETLLTQLIEINQQKLMILGNLLKQIENVNAKKGDTTIKNYTNIII